MGTWRVNGEGGREEGGGMDRVRRKGGREEGRMRRESEGWRDYG